MSPCHTALHVCIFLSVAGTLPCPSALILSLFTSVSAFFLLCYFNQCLTLNPVIMSVSDFKISRCSNRSFHFLHISCASAGFKIVPSQLALLFCLDVLSNTIDPCYVLHSGTHLSVFCTLFVYSYHIDLGIG